MHKYNNIFPHSVVVNEVARLQQHLLAAFNVLEFAELAVAPRVPPQLLQPAHGLDQHFVALAPEHRAHVARVVPQVRRVQERAPERLAARQPYLPHRVEEHRYQQKQVDRRR